jgi:hypothetical protein
VKFGFRYNAADFLLLWISCHKSRSQ